MSPGTACTGAGERCDWSARVSRGGLAAVGVRAEVKIIPVTPELETLRGTKDAHAAAEAEAVKALALRRATLRDIAEATGVPVARVKRILVGRESDAAPTTHSAAVPAEPPMTRP